MNKKNSTQPHKKAELSATNISADPTTGLALMTPDWSEVTMNSQELVDFINKQRKAGEAVLRHDSFMTKVPKVLGKAAPKFIGTDFYENGSGAKLQRKIYRFPKREACLMAMSYSYELQAMVLDRMNELEQSYVVAKFYSKVISLAAMIRDWESRHTESSTKGALGSRLMHQRCKEKKALQIEETLLLSKVQLQLPMEGM